MPADNAVDETVEGKRITGRIRYQKLGIIKVEGSNLDEKNSRG